MAITTHAMDVGALTPFLWGFEEREKLMEFYERISGARMHSAYIRPGGVLFDLNAHLVYDIYKFCKNFIHRINEIEELLTENRIWKQRLIDVGVVSKENVDIWGLTGVMARGTGVKVDVRKNKPYDAYNFINFTVPIGKNGDCYDRYKIRVEEMKQSVNIITQAICLLPQGFLINYNEIFKKSKKLFKLSMNSTINHFKNVSIKNFSFCQPKFTCVEAPKGEMVVFLSQSLEMEINRFKITAPGFFHLQLTSLMTYKHLIADVVTIIGTQDIVFGEVDR